MKTEKVHIMEDQSDGIYVRHVFWPGDDKRRHTAFYECVSIGSAAYLVQALIKQTTGPK